MPFILKYHIHTRSFHSKVCMYQMDPRTRCVRRKNVLEMGIPPHTRSHESMGTRARCREEGDVDLRRTLRTE